MLASLRLKVRSPSLCATYERKHVSLDESFGTWRLLSSTYSGVFLSLSTGGMALVTLTEANPVFGDRRVGALRYYVIRQVGLRRDRETRVSYEHKQTSERARMPSDLDR